MALTEDVLDTFFSDSGIKKQVGQDIFQFLKGPVERSDATQILQDKVNHALTKPANRKLIEDIAAAVPA